MMIQRSGTDIKHGSEGISNAPFLMQTLLSSQTDGEMTAMRAFFEPGGITHWHSHPLGQLLFVVDGVGLVQRDSGEVTEIHVGDSVWFAPGERHWHGATPFSLFSYISIQPTKDSTAVRWQEPVENRGGEW
jgi:quercetin dioxygenase-like cupin family protein